MSEWLGRAKEAEEGGREKSAEDALKIVEGYKGDIREQEERIKESESEREAAIAKEGGTLQEQRKQERLYDVWIVGVILLAVAVFIPAIYFAFIAQPAGPPFAF